jgi:hypothetical protein
MHKLHNRIGNETRLMLLLFYGIGGWRKLTIMKHLILPTFSLRLLLGRDTRDRVALIPTWCNSFDLCRDGSSSLHDLERFPFFFSRESVQTGLAPMISIIIVCTHKSWNQTRPTVNSPTGEGKNRAKRKWSIGRVCCVMQYYLSLYCGPYFLGWWLASPLSWTGSEISWLLPMGNWVGIIHDECLFELV